MALEKVVESILAAGRADAEAVKAKARAEAADVTKAAEAEAADVRSRRDVEARHAAEALTRREVASAELEAKKLRLNAQKETLAEVRRAVADRLAKLPPERRAQHIQSLLKRSTIKDGLVHGSAKDREAAEKLGVRFAGTLDTLGGIVVVFRDGSVREDFTYESLLDEVWNASLHEVAETLFKEP